MLSIDEVLAVEEAWTLAHLETDVEALDRLMHRDYTIIKPDGSVWDKETALASYVPGKRDWTEAGSSDHRVRIYEDTAVVVGVWRAKGVNNGEAFDYSARYVSVWVKEGDRIQMVSDQSTEIPSQ
ncbi:MAG: nuclear transport factor 2 family protein [Candidatus Bathyarchaeota archaeon]|nr:nuclear transport factor 2 family protein [Candidatus Bathyarchaeota archaeon]